MKDIEQIRNFEDAEARPMTPKLDAWLSAAEARHELATVLLHLPPCKDEDPAIVLGASLADIPALCRKLRVAVEALEKARNSPWLWLDPATGLLLRSELSAALSRIESEGGEGR